MHRRARAWDIRPEGPAKGELGSQVRAAMPGGALQGSPRLQGHPSSEVGSDISHAERALQGVLPLSPLGRRGSSHQARVSDFDLGGMSIVEGMLFWTKSVRKTFYYTSNIRRLTRPT